MSAEVFIRRWMGLIVLLGVMIVIAPYFVHVVISNSGCQGAADCGHAAEVLSHYTRRITLAIVLIPLLVTLAGRALSVGGFGWAFPFALLMLAGALPLGAEERDLSPLTTLGGLGEAPEVIPLVFLLLLLIAFSAHPDDSEGKGPAAWRTLLGFVALSALFVTAPIWTAGIATLPYITPMAAPLDRAIANGQAALGIQTQLGAYATYALMAFVLVTAGLLFSGRSGGNSGARARTARA